MGLTGPPLRCTGVDFDIRRDYPYSVYPELKFDVDHRHGAATSRLLPGAHRGVPAEHQAHQAVPGEDARGRGHGGHWDAA